MFPDSRMHISRVWILYGIYRFTSVRCQYHFLEQRLLTIYCATFTPLTISFYSGVYTDVLVCH